MGTAGGRLIVGALAVLTLSAQYNNLGAPGNGSELYFSINLPLKGSGDPQQGRIFKIGSTPLTLVAAVTNTGFPQPCIGYCHTPAYDLRQADASRDGSIVAYTGRFDCTGDSTVCAFHVNPYSTVVQGVPGQGALTYAGAGRLSGNGKYLVTAIPINLYGYTQFTLNDIEGGQQVATTMIHSPSAAMATNGRAVADDGTFAFADYSYGIAVYRNGKLISGPSITGGANAVISGAGDTAVYQVCCSPSQLRVFRPDTGEDRVLIEGQGIYRDPAISADGQKVAFLWLVNYGPGDSPYLYQLYTMNADGTGIQGVTNDPDGIAQFAISDDGQIAWYASWTGALYKVNIGTGESQQRIAASCSATLDSSVVVPGSAVLIHGPCLGGNTVVTLDGSATPIVGRQQNNVWVQVPWETPVSQPLAVVVNTGSPFEVLTAKVNTSARAPHLAAGLFHEDWSGVIGFNGQVRAGEVVHYYATGLGPVQPAVRTGEPGPLDPLSRVIAPVQCNAEVLYAGLAPGLVGFYQVDVRLPSSVQGAFTLTCDGADLQVVNIQP